MGMMVFIQQLEGFPTVGVTNVYQNLDAI